MVEERSGKRTEPWQITVGGSVWLAGFGGHTEFHGVNPYVKVGFEQILNHINVISSLAGEVRKGLWRPRQLSLFERSSRLASCVWNTIFYQMVRVMRRHDEQGREGKGGGAPTELRGQPLF